MGGEKGAWLTENVAPEVSREALVDALRRILEAIDELDKRSATAEPTEEYVELEPRIKSLSAARFKLLHALVRIAKAARAKRKLEPRELALAQLEGRATIEVLRAIDDELAELVAGGGALEQAKRRQLAELDLDRLPR